MHIVHVIDGLGLGGAERMLVDIANATLHDGHRVTVCVTRDNTLLRSALANGIEVVVLARRRRFDLAPVMRLARWIRANRVDVLHVHMRSSLSFMLALRSLHLVRTPIVFHDHYGTIETDSSVPRWFRVGRRMIDQYVGVYERLTEWAVGAGVDRARAMTIPNALDLTRLRGSKPVDVRTAFAVQDQDLVAILVATVRRDKGLEILIRALARTRSRERLRVLVVGSEPDAAYSTECRALVRQLDLESVVSFVGPRTDVPGLLLGADLGLLSSHTESGPLVLIEYLAARLPIVSTLVGNIGRDLHVRGVPGFVPPGDADAFAGAVDALVSLDHAARRARGERGTELLTESWNIRGAMPAWYLAYSRAIERGHA